MKWMDEDAKALYREGEHTTTGIKHGRLRGEGLWVKGAEGLGIAIFGFAVFHRRSSDHGWMVVG